jgi:hypothetical protein
MEYVRLGGSPAYHSNIYGICEPPDDYGKMRDLAALAAVRFEHTKSRKSTTSTMIGTPESPKCVDCWKSRGRLALQLMFTTVHRPTRHPNQASCPPAPVFDGSPLDGPEGLDPQASRCMARRTEWRSRGMPDKLYVLTQFEIYGRQSPRPRLNDESLSLALSLKLRGHEIRVKLLLHRMDRTYRPTRRCARPPDSAAMGLQSNSADETRFSAQPNVPDSWDHLIASPYGVSPKRRAKRNSGGPLRPVSRQNRVFRGPRWHGHCGGRHRFGQGR